MARHKPVRHAAKRSSSAVYNGYLQATRGSSTGAQPTGRTRVSRGDATYNAYLKATQGARAAQVATGLNALQLADAHAGAAMDNIDAVIAGYEQALAAGDAEAAQAHVDAFYEGYQQALSAISGIDAVSAALDAGDTQGAVDAAWAAAGRQIAAEKTRKRRRHRGR